MSKKQWTVIALLSGLTLCVCACFFVLLIGAANRKSGGASALAQASPADSPTAIAALIITPTSTDSPVERSTAPPPSPTATDVVVPTMVSTVAPATPVQPTAALSPSGLLESIARKELGQRLISSSLPMSGTVQVARIGYDLGVSAKDDQLAVVAVLKDFGLLASDVFTSDLKVGALEVTAFVESTDRYGQVQKHAGFKLTLLGRTASKINWGKINFRDIGYAAWHDDNGADVATEFIPAWIVLMFETN